MKEKLWNKNFTLMFIGNVISSLGGVGLNIALGVIVFDQTKSTSLGSIFTAVTSIPNLVLPLFAGAIVDRNDPLKLLLKNESLLIMIYVLLFFVTLNYGFNYVFYLIFFFLVSCAGVISQISGQSITAQLMNPKLMSKGYSIMSTIYPLCSVIVTPISLLIYNKFGFSTVIFIYIVLSIIDVILESRIDFHFSYKDIEIEGLSKIFSDMKDGVKYILNYKEIKYVFIFFTFVIISDGASTLIYPFFSMSKHLSLEQYSLLMTINSMGYMFGGFFHYFIEIPKHLRYSAALVIYSLFIVFDSVFLLMPITIMIIMKFFLGLCGMNSANIRNTAVQASISDEERGKVNGVFGMLMGLAGICGSLLFGFLGEYIYIPHIMILAQLMYLLAVIVFVVPKRNGIKNLYNLELTTE